MPQGLNGDDLEQRDAEIDSSTALEHMISAQQAAAALGCSDQTVRHMAEQGKIPGMRIGNRWLFLPSVLDKWRKEKLMANCSEGRAE